MNRTNPLPLSITPHHLHLSPSLRDFAYSKLAKVPRYSNDALRMDLVLRRHGGASEETRFSASARVALPGRDIHASAVHSDLYTAIVKLVGRLARHSRKRKTRRAKASKARRDSGDWNTVRSAWDVFDPDSVSREARDVTDAARGSGTIAASTSRKPVGLVERSTSSNPAHGFALKHLNRLTLSSRARAATRS